MLAAFRIVLETFIAVIFLFGSGEDKFALAINTKQNFVSVVHWQSPAHSWNATHPGRYEFNKASCKLRAA